MPTATRTAGTNGSTATSSGTLLIPKRGSELHALVNQMRAMHSGLHGDVSDIAAYLKTHLPATIEARGGSRKGMLGLDARLMATRVVKPLREISKLNDEISRLWVVTWVRYQENVENVRTNRHTNGFNADA